jgi:hypothetical protein
MNATNDGVVAAESAGFHYVDFGSGATAFTSLNQIPRGMTVDEDTGLVWTHDWSLHRGHLRWGQSSVQLTTLHHIDQFSPAVGPCWNGSTGGYVTCTPEGSRPGVLEFFDRSGTCTWSIGGIGYIHDIAWSPWTGDLILCDHARGTLLRATQNGIFTTIQTLSATPWKLKVLHQNPAGKEYFLVTELASPMSDILTVSGTGVVRTLISGWLQPLDVEALGSRSLWATGPWSVGSVGCLNLNPGQAYAHHAYRIALSFSHRPGLNLGCMRLHLAPDSLFFLTANGDVPGLTRGFSGILDGRGRAVVSPRITIPNAPWLRGLRVYGGGLTFDGSGITGATNCWGITIQ